ncbi:type I-E CRISPR-associated protein Cse2/CasB [Streptomyces sp. NPDC005393]|uniref:type I-E CRISPR-associated protein Cse2/CasB n=1 Tax=Streptomyces sp. NPDC005393 TaxID=3157041 RepID=UPI0033B6E2C0
MTTTATRDTRSDAPPEPRIPSLEPYDSFVADVRAQCADSGTQQALRRGLAKPVDEVPARTHAALLRGGLVPDDARGPRRRAYYAVAALIAARPRTQRLADADSADAQASAAAARGKAGGAAQTAGAADTAEAGHVAAVPGGDAGAPSATAGFRPSGTSLGESLAVAVTRQGPEGIKENGAEARLHLMVRQEADGIHRMLPAVLRQLGSAGVAADYACLLRDLIAWHHYRDSVATRWLEDFYRTLRREKAAATEDRAGSGRRDADDGTAAPSADPAT